MQERPTAQETTVSGLQPPGHGPAGDAPAGAGDPATSNVTTRMAYQTAATAIALLHLAFIIFVFLGGLLVLRWPKLAWVHLPAAVWGVTIEFFGWWCPLTKWENQLLRLAGRAGYDGGFVAHYIMPIIYPPGLTRGMEIGIGIIVLIINVSVYMKAFR